MYQFSKRNVHFFERVLNGEKVIKNADTLYMYLRFLLYEGGVWLMVRVVIWGSWR